MNNMVHLCYENRATHALILYYVSMTEFEFQTRLIHMLKMHGISLGALILNNGWY